MKTSQLAKIGGQAALPHEQMKEMNGCGERGVDDDLLPLNFHLLSKERRKALEKAAMIRKGEELEKRRVSEEGLGGDAASFPEKKAGVDGEGDDEDKSVKASRDLRDRVVGEKNGSEQQPFVDPVADASQRERKEKLRLGDGTSKIEEKIALRETSPVTPTEGGGMERKMAHMSPGHGGFAPYHQTRKPLVNNPYLTRLHHSTSQPISALHPHIGNAHHSTHPPAHIPKHLHFQPKVTELYATGLPRPTLLPHPKLFPPFTSFLSSIYLPKSLSVCRFSSLL